MSKAEEYIKKRTRGKVNHITENFPCVPVVDAIKAVKIVREEIYEWLSNNVFEDKYLDLRKMGIEHAFYGYKVDTLISDLKQAMKDEEVR